MAILKFYKVVNPRFWVKMWNSFFRDFVFKKQKENMFEDGLDCLKDWKRNLLLGIAILDFSKGFNPRFLGEKLMDFFGRAFLV